MRGEHTAKTRPGAAPGAALGLREVAGAGHLFRVLETRIRAQGYYPHEVARGLGRDPEYLGPERARDWTHTDLHLVCEFVALPPADLRTELGWLTHAQAREHLHQVAVAPPEVLADLVSDCAGNRWPHPVRNAWATLDRPQLHRQAVRAHRYLAWFLVSSLRYDSGFGNSTTWPPPY